MADNQRIDDLRRRVHKDPASIAFAQLAEELRRGGDYQESIEVCQAGLAIHPGYLSARVTLGRALLELDQLDDAQAELMLVLKSAPENLAALRALAETRQRQGSDADALASYRSALLLAKNDSFLQQAVDELSRKIEPEQPPEDAPSPAPPAQFSYAEPVQDLPLQTPPEPVAAFPHAQAIDDLPLHAPPEPVPVPEHREIAETLANVASLENIEIVENQENLENVASLGSMEIVENLENLENPENLENSENFKNLEPPLSPATLWAALAAPAQMTETGTEDTAAREKAVRTIAALEQWLEAVYVARVHRHA